MDQFLRNHASVSPSECTHTRIGSPDHGVYGGSYTILLENKEDFYKLYYRHVFEQGKSEHLTEKQLPNGPIAIDLDFRYKEAKRAYTSNDILEFVDTAVQQLNTVFTITQNFPIYVFEKHDINVVADDKIKDGIHMIIGVNMDKTAKELFRKKLLDSMNIWNHLSEHLTNNWDSVIDAGVMKGTTNWQLYGSSKPGHEAYKLTKVYTCQKDEDSEYVLHSSNMTSFDIRKELPKLSIQYAEYETPLIKEAFQPEYNQFKNVPRKKLRVVSSDNTSFTDIICEASLNRALENLLGNKSLKDYKLHETHEYTMVLPAKYHDEYELWLKVGWALKNTDIRLFVSWIKFSSKSAKFSYSDVPKYFGMWCSWNKPDNQLTERSIMFWARNENLVEYEKVKEKSVSVYIDSILKETVCTEFDLAKIMYQWYKDLFVCVSINSRCWFEYSNQRWQEMDSGTRLFNYISDFDGIYGLFRKKLKVMNDELANMQDGDEQKDLLEKRQKKVCTIMINLKKTDKKSNIMKEACHLFYIKDFMNLLDSKNHILCFSNGVIDFNTKKFRQGLPDDYTSKSTNIPYIPIAECDPKIIDEISEFMKQLFPEPELCNYMWDHAASTLIGKNNNQTFNMYTGGGRNGKSKFVQLMSLALGEYKGTCPITLVTQKRTSIGSTSSEIVDLMGKRYVVMQEPNEDDEFNEGILKEITGDDPIQGRALYKNTVTFYPQFTLALCSNFDLKIKGKDDGIWRRIRKCAFKSVFTENPVSNNPNKPYQFKVDTSIDEKFELWKTTFMSMLAERAFVNNGHVKDCQIVMSTSEQYRKNQDQYAEFIRDRIVSDPSGSIKEVEMYETFKEWWKLLHGHNMPKGKQLFDYITNTFGAKKGRAWKGIALIKDQESEDEMNEL
jgi:P4 family phage/plasmid primase-like protien